MNTLGKIKAAKGSVVTLPLDLGDYAETYRGAIFEVWVTPTRGHMKAWGAILTYINERNVTLRAEREAATAIEGEADREAVMEAINEASTATLAEYNERVLVWYADTWTNIPLDEAREIRDHLTEVDPLAWDWLVNRTSTMIGEYRKATLKN